MLSKKCTQPQTERAAHNQRVDKAVPSPPSVPSCEPSISTITGSHLTWEDEWQSVKVALWGTREVENSYGRMQKEKGTHVPFISLFFFVKKYTQYIK